MIPALVQQHSAHSETLDEAYYNVLARHGGEERFLTRLLASKLSSTIHPFDPDDFTLRFAYGRFSALEGGASDTCFRTIWGVFFVGTEAVGYCTFEHWRFAHDYLWCDLEAASQKTCEFGDALVANWFIEELPDTMLVFDRLWIKPGWAKKSRWADSVIGLIQRVGSRNNIGAMVFKPFPLEFEGCADDTPRFARRRDALQRLYRQTLSAEPLPGRPEWMWVALDPGLVLDPCPTDMCIMEAVFGRASSE